jgi:hypothetical protein
MLELHIPCCYPQKRRVDSVFQGCLNSFFLNPESIVLNQRYGLMPFVTAEERGCPKPFSGPSLIVTHTKGRNQQTIGSHPFVKLCHKITVRGPRNMIETVERHNSIKGGQFEFMIPNISTDEF